MYTVRITCVDDFVNEEFIFATYEEAEDCVTEYARVASNFNQMVEVLENGSVIKMCFLGQHGFGRWGRMRLDFLLQYNRQLYEELKESRGLAEHLMQVEVDAQKVFDDALLLLNKNGFSQFGRIAIVLAEEQALAQCIYR